jgi:hypothetical protein
MSEIGQGEGRTVRTADTDAAAPQSLVHHGIELILARHLAGYLAVPSMIIGPGGTMIFSMTRARAFAELCGVRMLAPFQRDPAHTDLDIDRMVVHAISCA